MVSRFFGGCLARRHGRKHVDGDVVGRDRGRGGVERPLVSWPKLQIEGFAEKYGMEYRRAYWDEQPDAALVERHEREIFPLLRRRHLFAEVENFLLYDFFTPEGNVNEDVFA